MAVNKHIQKIRGWGLDVLAIQNKGYRLAYPLDLIDEQRLAQQLDTPFYYCPIIDSTNQYLLDHIKQLMSGSICIAEYQTAARGRRGRRWYSPFASNLYYSMYWQLSQGPMAAMGLSLVIGMVLAQTLHALGETEVKVKWPNDLYLQGKKLAGILVELSGATADIAHVVLGIGINLNMHNIDPDIVTQDWAKLDQLAIDRTSLVILLSQKLQQALVVFEQQGLKPFIEQWQALDNFYNCPVKLLMADKEIKGIAKGINQQGALLLEQDGIITAYLGGEISLRAN